MTKLHNAQDAIEQAVEEGGYNVGDAAQKQYFLHQLADGYILEYNILTKSAFWQALGKALGKNGVEYPFSGGVAIVDAEMIPQLNEWSWSLQKGYARGTKKGSGGRKTLFMHRLVLGPVFSEGKGEMADHINRNRLDNRLSNLRVVDAKTNGLNKHDTKLGKYRGLSFHPRSEKWQGVVRFGGKRYYAGYFADKDKAAEATEKLRREVFGEIYTDHGLHQEWWFRTALRYFKTLLSEGDEKQFWESLP